MKNTRQTAAGRPPRTWVVTADAARARIFRAAGDKRLVELEGLLNPVAGRAERALRSDRQGHASNATHGGGHSLQRNAESGSQQETAGFARRLARRLASGRRHGEFDKIYLMAEPRLLGAVRGCLDRPTRRLVAGEIDKDLTRERPTAIRQRLPARL